MTHPTVDIKQEDPSGVGKDQLPNAELAVGSVPFVCVLFPTSA